MSARRPAVAAAVHPPGAGASPRAEVGTLTRGMHLLRLLATAGRRGLGLTELAQATALPHSSVHRLLHQLMAERMVQQRESNRRYTLGRMAFELGLAAAAMYDLRDACRHPLRDLAERVGDTVYLTVRSGWESVCEDRYEGPSPIRVLTLDIGSRRPLGQGAGGLAILAYLPEDEREDAIAELGRRYADNQHLSVEMLQQAVHQCRQRGYAWIKDRVNLGVSAVGVPLFDSLDRPIAAISVAAVNSRLSGNLVPALADTLQAKAREIRGRLGVA